MARSLLLLALVFLAPASSPPVLKDRNLVVIVHPQNAVEKLTLTELRRLFRAERKHWPDGDNVVLVMREAYSKERTLFIKAVYGMEEIRYRRFWLEKVFRGEAARPQTAMSAESMKEIVGRQKGAIGYLWGDQADDSVKVLTIDGQRAIALDKEDLPPASGE